MSTRFVTFASVISEIEQSDVFMTVRARILETPKANLNGCRVTEAFVDDVINHKERYVGLPLYADKKALVSGKYDRLGHLYDSRTGEFHSTQIGSFYEFEKEEFDGGAYLVGYARIPKRDKDLSKAIAELFAEGKLKFSFEIACGEYNELDDDTIEIDASENNYLEGTAIVTFPACEDAVALEFVAQRSDDTRKGDEEMAEEKLVAEETNIEAATPQVAECDEKEKADEEVSEVTEPVETAQVYVTETHEERNAVHAYDTETGKEIHEEINVSTTVCEPVEGNIVEADDGVHIAETDENGDKVAEQADEQVAEQVAEVVENPVDKYAETLNALAEAIKTLTAEVQEMKDSYKKSRVVAEVNPFMENMTTNGTKYSLLEEDVPSKSYSLLSE